MAGSFLKGEKVNISWVTDPYRAFEHWLMKNSPNHLDKNKKRIQKMEKKKPKRIYISFDVFMKYIAIDWGSN